MVSQAHEVKIALDQLKMDKDTFTNILTIHNLLAEKFPDVKINGLKVYTETETINIEGPDWSFSHKVNTGA